MTDIRIKIWAGGILLVILSSLISWNVGKATHSFGEDPERSSRSAGAGSSSGGENDINGHQKTARPAQGKPPQVEVVDQLETMAGHNPGLVARLNIRLFDNNLDLNPDDWKLLGIDKEVATVVSDDLKGIFKGIKEKETTNFSIIEQSDSQIQVSLPKLEPEEAASRVAQMQGSFAKVFGPELSKQMTQMFIDSHPAIAAGLAGKDRVVTITTASENAIHSLNRKYEIRTQVLYPGTKLSDAVKNLDNYSQDSGIELVESIPENWAHLFGKSD